MELLDQAVITLYTEFPNQNFSQWVPEFTSDLKTNKQTNIDVLLNIRIDLKICKKIFKYTFLNIVKTYDTFLSFLMFFLTGTSVDNFR